MCLFDWQGLSQVRQAEGFVSHYGVASFDFRYLPVGESTVHASFLFHPAFGL